MSKQKAKPAGRLAPKRVMRKCGSKDCKRMFDPKPMRRVPAPGGKGHQWIPYAGTPKEYCSERCATRERVRQFRARAQKG